MTRAVFSAAEILEADEQARKKRGLLEQQRAHVHNIVDVQSRQDTANRSEALQLSRSRGAPVDVVERNMAAFRAQDAFEQLSPGNAVALELSDSWSQLLGSPLGALAVKDPAGTQAISAAARAETVNPKTGAPWRYSDVPGQALEKGQWQVNVGYQGGLRVAGKGDEARWHYLHRPDVRPQPMDVPGSWHEDWLAGEVITQFPVVGSIIGAGLAGAGAGAATFAPPGALLGAGPGGAAIAAGFGAGTGYIGGLFTGAMWFEAGLALSEFEEISAEIERRTGEKIPHDVQRGAAALAGLVNAGFETVSLGALTILARLPGARHLKRHLTRSAGAYILKSRDLRPILLNLAKRAGLAALGESITEGAQEATVIALGEGMVRWSTEEENDIWSKENLQRVGQSALVGGAVGTSFVVGASPVVSGIEKVSMNQAAKRRGEQLDSLNEAANSPIGTTLREADPAAFRAWLQSQIEKGGGDPNLYLNARDFMEFFQSEGIDPETVMESMPDVAEQLPVALSTNADLVIPIADYTTYLNQHHEGLKPHVRHGLRKPSRGDAEANEAEDEARLQADVERLAALDDLSAEVRELETQILALEEAAPTPRAAEGLPARSILDEPPPPKSAERVTHLRDKRAALIERGFPARMFLGPEPVEVIGIISGGRKDAPLLEPTLENLNLKGSQVRIRTSNGESAIALVDQLEFTPRAPTPRAEAPTPRAAEGVEDSSGWQVTEGTGKKAGRIRKIRKGTDPETGEQLEVVLQYDKNGKLDYVELRTAVEPGGNRFGPDVWSRRVDVGKVLVEPGNNMGPARSFQITDDPNLVLKRVQGEDQDFFLPAPPTPRAAEGARVPWSTREGTSVQRAEAFDALPGDAEVTLFHATSDANAANLIGGGKAAPQRQGRGIEAIDDGIYVGTDPISVEGMGPRILAVTVKKSQVSPSSEFLRTSPDGTAGRALVQGAATGGVVRGKPIRVEDVTDTGRYAFAADATPTPRAAEAPELAALRQQLAEKKAERDATTTPGEQVEQTFLQRLVRAGAMRPADARYLGILLRQNAERRAAGAAGEEAFAQAGGEHAVLAEVEGVEEEARPSLEQALEKVKLGALLNELRLGLQPELKGLPKWPILQALRPTQYGGGGVAPGSKLAGELLNMGITPQSLPGLYRVGGNTDLDQFDLTDNPYLVGLEMDAYGRPSDRAVLDAIDKEWRGNPLRTEEQLEGILARQIPREELGRILDQLGIDLKTTTNEEVITDLEQRFSDRGIEPEVLEETVEGDEFFQQSIAQGWHAVDATPEQQVALDRIIDAHPRAAEIREQFELHRGTPYHDQAAYGAITRQHLEDLLAGLEVDYESGLDNPRFTKVKAAAAAGPEALWAYLETNSFIGRAGKPINSVNGTFLNCRPSLACAKFCYATEGNYRFDNTVFKAELVNWAVENDPVRAAQMAARQYKATAEYLLDKALRLNDKGDISEAWIPFIEELNRQDVRVQVFSKRPEVLRQVPEVNLRLLSVDDTNSQQMAADNPDLMLAVVYQGVEDIPFLVQYADRVQVILPVKLGRRTLSKDEIAPIPKDMRKHICPVDGFGKTVGKTADGKWNCTRCDKNGGLGCYVNTTTKSVLKQLRKDIQNEPDELQTRLDEIRELAGTMEGEERQRLLGRVDLLVSAIRRGVDLEKEEGVIADDEASRDRLTVLEQAALPDERPLEGAFFSALGRALRTSPQRSMSLPELQAYLKKRGVKQEEIEWTMLEDFFEFASLQHWLASNPDTRPPGPQADMKLDLDSLMEQIKLIKVEEVVLGGEWGWRGAALDATDPEDVGAWALGLKDPWEQVVEGEVPGEDEGLWQLDARGQNEAGDEWHYTVTWDEEAGELSVFELDEEADASAERIYHQALEGHRGSPPDLDDARDAAGGAIREDVRAKTRAKLRQRGIGGPAQYGEWTLPGGENYREYLITLPVTGDAFTDGHFGDVAPNVLVHARVKDRVGPNGEKILFIEEIQDDWAKEGREKGYGAGLSEEEMEELASLEQKYRSEPPFFRLRHFMPILQRIKQLQAKSTQPPDRPFKASGASSMLALKRMIAKAAKEGYDSVAWTTGKIQVDRYQDELRQSVDAIEWSDEPTLGRYQVWKTVPEGEAGDHNERLHDTYKTAEEAADVVEYRNTRSDESKGDEIDVEYRVVDPAPGAFLVEAKAVKDGVEVIQLLVNRETGMVVSSSVEGAVEKPLESIVGKDIAAKILGETEGEVSGDDLTIGGKGFEDLYDGILVRGADKLGKKFGTKVEKAELEAPTTIDPSGRLRYEVWEEPVHLAMGEVIGEPRLEDAFETMAQAQERTAEYNERAQTEDAPFHYQVVDGGKAGRRPTVHNLPISEELRASVEGEGLPLFQAAGTGPRGSLKFDADLRNIIMRFTEASDLSTGLHELGHLFFLFMGQDVQRPGADQKLLADMQAAFDYFGLTENKARALKEAQRAAKSWAKKEGVPVPEITLEDLEAVLDAGLDIDPSNPAHRFASVGFHEIWAKSFEAYLFEGRAPSVELEGAFRRFRQWLLQVYRTILKLNVELTPEIREVFDRLLATDEQIERVRSQPHMQPKFESAEAGGMNEAEFADYQAAYERMKAKAEREIMVKLMAEKRREQTEEWALEYERMYAQAEADINAQPAYQLRHWLQRGELLGQETPEELEHVRLDRAAVVRLYGKEILNVLPSRGTYSVVQKGGVDPDVLAPFFGFKTGDALVRALAETINREKAITQEADARMKARFGDMLNDGTIGELAIASMEGEARSTFLGRELRLLARRAGQRGTPQAVARRVAKRVIAGKRVRDLRPDLYRRAEERNAREILEASAAGDHARAHQAGMEQLHNHFLVVESMRAKEQAQKWSDYLRRMDTLTTRARIGKAGEDYLDQIDALLDRFDFRKISNKAADRRASLAKWIAEQEAADETAVFEISDALREEASSKPWREMTMEELRDLVDAVKNIEHLALLKGKLLRAKEQRDLNAAVERALEGIETNRRSDREALPVETRTVEQRWIRRVGQWFAGHRKFASLLLEMDGGPGGAFFDLILRPMDESGDFETAEREKAWNALKELFRPFVPLDQRVKQLATTVTRGKVDAVKPDIELARHVPGTGTNVPALTLQGRLMAVLNMGNAGNRQRLLDNYGWTENDAKAIIDSLSREQMDFVQGVWDFIDSYWEASAAQQRRISGVVPQRIERVPLQTKWGMYAGGYLPAVYDALQSERAYSQDVANAAADTMRGAHTRAVTRRSHMKERAVKVTDRKIRLDFGVIFEHVDGVIHALAWHEWLIDANKIIGDPRISDAIKRGYGEPVYRDLAKALEDFAAGDVAAEDIRETAFNWLRMGSSVAGMGYNVMTAALQPYGLTQSMVRIGPKWVGVGIAKWLRGADVQETTVKWIYSKSSMMENRSRTMNREIREIQSRVSKGGLFDPISDSYFYLIVKAQQIVDIPTWLGAYEKEMDNSGDESRAIAMADRAVIDAQGGGQIQDLARFQRGSPMFKLWTNFYSFFNTTHNLTAESYERTDFKNPGEVGRFAVDMLLLYTLPSVLTTMMSDAIYQRYDDDESWGEYALELLTLGQLSYVANTMVGVRELSGGLQGWFDYDGPAGTRFFSAAGDLMRQVSQGELDFSLLKALNQTGGILFHYPSVLVQRFADGVISLESGEATSPTVLLTGPPKKRK